MSYLGDIRASQVLYFHFTTRQFSTGAPITASSLAVSVYKDDSITESTSGITTTFTTGFDSRAGLVSVKIDTSSDGTFYAGGHDFSVVVTGGTADSVSIVGEVVGYFSIENRSGLMPTTSGRTLDVSAGGEAGLDWANVGSPTTSLALTGTTIATTQKVDVDTIKTNPVVNGGTITFPTGATLASTTNITAGTITTTTNLTNLPSIPANWITAAGISAAALNGKGDWLLSSSYTAPTNLTAAQIATGVWTDTTAGDFTAALSVGKSLMNGVALGTGLTINDLTTKTGYALTSAYDAAKTAAQAGDAMALTSGERNSTADALLGRNISGGSSTGRTVKQALHFLRNKWTIATGALTVYDTDDTTSSWTATVGTDAAAVPIVSNDPA